MNVVKPLALLLGAAGVFSLYFALQDYRGTQTIQLSKKLFVDFEFDRAIALSDEATRISPLDAEAYLNQAYIQGTLWIYRKEDSYRKAMDQAYAKAQQLNPKNASYHYQQASIYFEGQDFTKAITHIDQAITLDPLAAAYLYEKGTYLEAQNRKAEALALYRRAYQLNDSSIILQDIQRLEGQP
ncbi:hypothetical protein DC3_32410 [Deinococcus cellulosilyticus NBRC 106333 = KACC 11606]|uniref:Uncharacterized protein n=2 Tax=Deinococcus cellulosilyticus TaxID=401558 RepID=A0A511N5A0_DEIC1|nr:hypothetical protein DC3_32410 [Deinococcus cellulosilyticus NBRC 106333 = KACC 11606]